MDHLRALHTLFPLPRTPSQHPHPFCLSYLSSSTISLRKFLDTSPLQTRLAPPPYMLSQHFVTELLHQGSQPRPVPVHGLLRTRLHSRRWAVSEETELHLYLQLLPFACITAWAPPPVRSVAALNSHRRANSTVNCTCKVSRLHTPYENLMPDDLR